MANKDLWRNGLVTETKKGEIRLRKK